MSIFICLCIIFSVTSQPRRHTLLLLQHAASTHSLDQRTPSPSPNNDPLSVAKCTDTTISAAISFAHDPDVHANTTANASNDGMSHAEAYNAASGNTAAIVPRRSSVAVFLHEIL